MREAVITAAQTDQYSKTAYLCAEGSQTPAACDVDYWNLGGTPGTEEDCNFLYLRVANDYWTGLTPMVLAQYTNYLGVTADGKDPANQEAGPHTTVAEYGGDGVGYQPRGSSVASLPLTGGKLDATSTAAALSKVVAAPVPGANPTTISPVLAGADMTIDCSTVGVYSGGAWTATPIGSVTPANGTSFACTGTGEGIGTASRGRSLLEPTADSVPIGVSIKVASDTTNTLRKDTSAPFESSNVVWPTGLTEVTAATPYPLSIQSGDVCKNDTSGAPESCLHLWVNKGNEQNKMACQIWFTLEIDSAATLETMTKYGLSTDGYTPHISLAKRKVKLNEAPPPYGTAPAGTRDPCTDAANIAAGKPGVDPATAAKKS